MGRTPSHHPVKTWKAWALNTIIIVAVIWTVLSILHSLGHAHSRRDKTNTGSNPGWPMNVAQSGWPAGLIRTQARADSILNAITTFVGENYDATTNGDARMIDSAKAAAARVGNTFRYYQYNSFQDNYVSGPEIAEHQWLVAQTQAAALDSEILYLHFWDSTQMNLQGSVLSFPGVAPTRAKTKADTVNSRVPAYYSNRSRIIPDYTNPWVRTRQVLYAKNQMTTYSTTGGTHADYPDGVFWDNTQTRFYNYGTRVYGGHVAELSNHPRIDSFPDTRLDYWTDSFIVPFFTELKDTFDNSLAWSLDGQRKDYYVNTSGLQDVDYYQNDITYGVGHEANPDPLRTDAGAVMNMYRWDSACAANGVCVYQAPTVSKTVSGYSGSYSHKEAIRNCLAIFYITASDSSSLSVLWGQSSVYSFYFPDTAWIGAMDFEIGARLGGPTVLATGTDGRNQSATVYKRQYENGFVLFRGRRYNEHFDTLTAFPVQLGADYREIGVAGDTGAVVTATTLRPGQGRIFTTSGGAPSLPYLKVTPTAFNLTVQENVTITDEYWLTISNIGGGTLSRTVTSSAWWVDLRHPLWDSQLVYFYTTSFDPGIYHATITVTDVAAPNSPVVVPVTVTVTQGPVLAVSRDSLYFSAWQDSAAPDAQIIDISNSGGGSLIWTADVDSPWVSVSPLTDTGNGQVVVWITATDGPVGTYVDTLTVTAVGASGSPINIPVVYWLTADTVPVTPTGACCFSNGICAVTTQVQCESQWGAYQGDATTCSPNPCPQPADASGKRLGWGRGKR